MEAAPAADQVPSAGRLIGAIPHQGVQAAPRLYEGKPKTYRLFVLGEVGREAALPPIARFRTSALDYTKRLPSCRSYCYHLMTIT